MTGTRWAAVPGWEGFYEVSVAGVVRSLARLDSAGRPVRARELRPRADRWGHQRVALCRDGRCTDQYIHRLVLLAFTGPCPPGMEACHSDGNPANNALANLRWDTPSANQMDKVRHGRHWNKQKQACVNGHPFTPGNIYWSRERHRSCRACVALRDAERQRQRRKEIA